jgi:hypothetical protein
MQHGLMKFSALSTEVAFSARMVLLVQLLLSLPQSAFGSLLKGAVAYQIVY